MDDAAEGETQPSAFLVLKIKRLDYLHPDATAGICTLFVMIESKCAFFLPFTADCHVSRKDAFSAVNNFNLYFYTAMCYIINVLHFFASIYFIMCVMYWRISIIN